MNAKAVYYLPAPKNKKRHFKLATYRTRNGAKRNGAGAGGGGGKILQDLSTPRGGLRRGKIVIRKYIYTTESLII